MSWSKKFGAPTAAGWRFPLGFVALALVVVAVTSLTLVFRVNPTLISRYNEVVDGMSRADVENLLGPPDEIKLIGADRQQLRWLESPEEAEIAFHLAPDGSRQVAEFKTFRFTGPTGWRWRVRRWFERQ